MNTTLKNKSHHHLPLIITTIALSNSTTNTTTIRKSLFHSSYSLSCSSNRKSIHSYRSRCLTTTTTTPPSTTPNTPNLLLFHNHEPAQITLTSAFVGTQFIVWTAMTYDYLFGMAATARQMHENSGALSIVLNPSVTIFGLAMVIGCGLAANQYASRKVAQVEYRPHTRQIVIKTHSFPFGKISSSEHIFHQGELIGIVRAVGSTANAKPHISIVLSQTHDESSKIKYVLDQQGFRQAIQHDRNLEKFTLNLLGVQCGPTFTMLEETEKKNISVVNNNNLKNKSVITTTPTKRK
jgi:hypothetical protein